MLQQSIAAVRPLDGRAMADARAHLDRLTKPPGSLGRLEELAVQLAGITGERAPRFDRRTIVVATADHGVAARAVSAYPSDVTAQMVTNFLAGGAAISALARLVGAEVVVLDVGVAGAVHTGHAPGRPGTRLIDARIRDGTADMSIGPAMTRDEALRAIQAGLQLATDLAAGGVRLVGLGEMGIGNTTAASAVVAALTGLPPRRVVGRGTGLDEEGLARKVDVVETALAVNRPDAGDPVGVLACVGGLEIAALVGLAIGSAAAGLPVVLDGFIVGAAALVATRLCAALPGRLVAAHRSAEPGHAVVLDVLGLRPLLELDLRLGEGTGAALAIGLIDAACRVRDEMATFESAAVSGPLDARAAMPDKVV